MATLDAVTAKSAARDVEAEIVGLDPRSEQLHRKLTGQFSGSP